MTSKRITQTVSDQDLRERVLPEELQVLSIEQLEFRRHTLEEKLPSVTADEGAELANLYAFFRARK